MTKPLPDQSNSARCADCPHYRCGACPCICSPGEHDKPCARHEDVGHSGLHEIGAATRQRPAPRHKERWS